MSLDSDQPPYRRNILLLEPFADPFTAPGPSRIGFVTSRGGESADRERQREKRRERKSDDCGRGGRGRGRDRVELVELVFADFASNIVQLCCPIWTNMVKAILM